MLDMTLLLGLVVIEFAGALDSCERSVIELFNDPAKYFKKSAAGDAQSEVQEECDERELGVEL